MTAQTPVPGNAARPYFTIPGHALPGRHNGQSLLVRLAVYQDVGLEERAGGDWDARKARVVNDQ